MGAPADLALPFALGLLLLLLLLLLPLDAGAWGAVRFGQEAMRAASDMSRSSKAACPESGRMVRDALGSSRSSRAPEHGKHWGMHGQWMAAL